MSWRHPDDGSSALSMIDGKIGSHPENPTRVSPSKVQVGQRHAFRVRVVCEGDEAEVAVELDGSPYFRWKGPESSLSQSAPNDVPHQRTIGLGVRGGQITYHDLTLTMLDGEAWLLRPPRR